MSTDIRVIELSEEQADTLMGLINREAGLCQPPRDEDERRRSDKINDLIRAVKGSPASARGE